LGAEGAGVLGGGVVFVDVLGGSAGVVAGLFSFLAGAGEALPLDLGGSGF